MARVNDLLDRVQRMEAGRDQWVDQWQVLAEVFLPNQADFTTGQAKGRKRNFKNYENTHRVAARNFAAVLGSLIGPQDEQQLTVLPEDEELAERDDTRLWLDEVRSRMWRAMSRTSARYTQAKGETDRGLVVFGTGALFIGENESRDGLLFRSHHMRDVAVGVNAAGEVDRLSFKRRLTPRQAVEEFGESNIGEKTREALRGSAARQEQKFEFVHLILPREDRDARAFGPRAMAYASVVIDKDSEHIVRESGFHEFPFAVPRWETSPDEIYGRSPAMLAFADARTLQAIARTMLVGGQMAVDPPKWMVNDGVASAARLFPGGTTVFDFQAVEALKGPPMGALDIGARIPFGRDMQADYRALVQATFFQDLFASAVERPNMTATEVLERKEEMVRVLGPTFGRLEEDYIGRIVERVFHVMERAGAFPERPEELQDSRMTFSYFSPFQQARRSSEAVGISRSLEMLAPVAQVDPSVLDHYDFDEIVRDTPQWFGFAEKYIKAREAVETIRQQRAAQLAAEQAAQFAEAGTGAIRNLGAAERDFASAAGEQ